MEINKWWEILYLLHLTAEGFQAVFLRLQTQDLSSSLAHFWTVCRTQSDQA